MVDRNNNAKPSGGAILEKNPVSSSEAQRAAALTTFHASGYIETARGFFLIEDQEARDEVEMRSARLMSLLQLMAQDGSASFLNTGDGIKHHLLSMASDMAEELHALRALASVEEAQAAGGAK
jgi:hypothetical protein